MDHWSKQKAAKVRNHLKNKIYMGTERLPETPRVATVSAVHGRDLLL